MTNKPWFRVRNKSQELPYNSVFSATDWIVWLLTCLGITTLIGVSLLFTATGTELNSAKNEISKPLLVSISGEQYSLWLVLLFILFLLLFIVIICVWANQFSTIKLFFITPRTRLIRLRSYFRGRGYALLQGYRHDRILMRLSPTHMPIHMLNRLQTNFSSWWEKSWRRLAVVALILFGSIGVPFLQYAARYIAIGQKYASQLTQSTNIANR